MTDYKKPLEESNPPILPDNKVSQTGGQVRNQSCKTLQVETMFYRVPEILQCHSQFRIALTEAVKNWDQVTCTSTCISTCTFQT